MKAIVKSLKGDIVDEQGAHVGYRRQAKVLNRMGNKAGKRSLLGIAKDEADHKRILVKLLKKVAKKKQAKKGKKRK